MSFEEGEKVQSVLGPNLELHLAKLLPYCGDGKLDLTSSYTPSMDNKTTSIPFMCSLPS